MVAVTYNTDESIVNAKEWLLLQPKESWYNNLITHLRHQLSDKEKQSSKSKMDNER